MKKFLSVLLVLSLTAVLFASCGDKPVSSSASTPAASSESTPAEPVEKPYNARVLTGLEKTADYPDDQRFAAFMVNNISNNGQQNARPQAGLSDADMLVEIKVEGGITRFMALYEDYTKIPKIMPVRSARDQFFQLILPFHPLYVHIGESVVQTEYKNNYDYGDFDVNLDNLSGGFPRDQERRNKGVAIEHTAYVDEDTLQKALSQFGTDTSIHYNSTFFDFVRYDEPARELTGGDAVKIDVIHSDNYRTYFEWDAAAGKYLMSQYSLAQRAINPSVDANNNEQLSFDNVLVLFTDIHTYTGHEAKDLQEVVYSFGGVGYYFNGGKAEQVRWMKGTPDNVLRIVDTEGYETNVKINPGKTYLAIVDLDEAENFQFYRTTETAQPDSVVPNESAANAGDE